MPLAAVSVAEVAKTFGSGELPGEYPKLLSEFRYALGQLGRPILASQQFLVPTTFGFAHRIPIKRLRIDPLFAWWRLASRARRRWRCVGVASLVHCGFLIDLASATAEPTFGLQGLRFGGFLLAC